MNREVLVGALINPDSFGFMGEISDFHSDFIQLVDLNIFEDNLGGYDF